MNPDNTTDQRWLSFKEAMRKRYGEPLYRIPLDAGGSCPNRNENGSGGCAFCADDGARAIQTGTAATLKDQCDVAIAFARRRYGAKRFMGYLQTYTNTGGDGPLASGMLTKLALAHDMPAFTVATRPDCIDDASIEQLAKLGEVTDVYVELGIQSTDDEALAAVNRGHDWQCSQLAVRRLADAGLRPVAHMILGLPGESEASILEGARQLAQLPLAGIKLHNLHVIRGTSLAKRYGCERFPLYGPYDYAELLLQYLRLLPDSLPILRLTTDTPDEHRVAPNWAMEKGAFLEMLNRLMRLRNVRQGDLLAPPASWTCPEGYTVKPGFDGSPTVFVPDPGTHTHPPTGSLHIAQHAFIGPAALGNRLSKECCHELLDVGAGLGTNSLLACERAAASGGWLHVTALDVDRHLLELGIAHATPPEDALLDWRAILTVLRDTGHFVSGRISIDWIEGDIHHTLPTLDGQRFDTIFYDPYPPPYNPDLWSVDAAEQAYGMLTEDGRLIARKPPHAFHRV
jgi:radical SAM protein (TIGR01212 family)